MVHSKIKILFEEFFALVGSILLGIPIGLIVGIICWFKFPLQVYREARINLATQRINKAKEILKKSEPKDIWENHIKRMEEKKPYDN